MKNIIFILSVIILFTFLCCSYDEPESEDKIPPSKVYLTPHLGDTGDPEDTLNTINDKNNGIDPVQSGNLDYNWMKIKWGDELKKDPDIDHIDIYRFYITIEDTITLFVDQIVYEDTTMYIDKFTDLVGSGIQIIQRTWSYYIIPYDEADNFTNSDTVSYRLIDKPGLENPQDDYVSSIGDTITFSWSGPPNYSYRILFFTQSHNLLYAQDINDLDCNIVPSDLEGLIPTLVAFWRIDAFDGVGGSESEERRITFSPE